MKIYDVSCYDKTSGKCLWSQSQEAESPAESIAQACLDEYHARLFLSFIADEGLDELETLTVSHPGKDMADSFNVTAEPWEN